MDIYTAADIESLQYFDDLEDLQHGQRIKLSKVEVTPEMMKAGFRAFYEIKEYDGSFDVDAHIYRVYQAMRRAEVRSPAGRDQS